MNSDGGVPLPTPAPLTDLPKTSAASLGSWSEAVLLGLGALALQAATVSLAGSPPLPLGLGPGLYALVRLGRGQGLLALALGLLGLVGSPGAAWRAAGWLLAAFAVAEGALRLRSLALAAILYALTLGALFETLLANSLGAPLDLAFARTAWGLVAAALLAELALLALGRPLGQEPGRETPLWAHALPRAMVIVTSGGLLVAAGLALMQPASAAVAVGSVLGAGLLAGLAVGTLTRRVTQALETMAEGAQDAGTGTLRGRRPVPTGNFPIRELRDVASAMNAMHQSLAFYDATTRLPNRNLLEDRLELTIAQSAHRGDVFALLMVDLDRFRAIDASLGREPADELLGRIARRVEECARPGDTVARVGGDEFALLLPGLGRLEQAEEVAANVLEAVKRPYSMNGQDVFVTASVGISLYPRDGADAESLLKNASTATYAAKEKGQDTYRRYTARLSVRDVQRLVIERGLRRALENDELVLHFQPIVELGSGKIERAEALVRWHGEGGRLVPPGEFIPIAEASGLISAVDSWVLKAACARARALHERGRELRVSVNLSARQLQQDDLVEQVKHALAANQLPSGRIGVEVTESSAMQDPERSATTLGRLREMGLSVSIDDFGTGYSSLSYLKRLPVDTVKLDRAFVRELETNADDAAIATAVIAMAHSLKLDVVAEGVETAGQARFLEQRGCDAIQGFLFSPAVPFDDLLALLDQEPARLTSAS